MSFAKEVRKTLVKHYTKNAHCQAAELAAVILFAGRTDENGHIIINTEDEDLAKKCFAAFKKYSGKDLVIIEVTDGTSRKKKQFRIEADEAVRSIFGYNSNCDDLSLFSVNDVPEKIIGKTCCKRAFLRGAFIAAGTASDPEKNYHLEIVCPNEKQARFTADLMNGFGISAKVSLRRGRYLVYIKEAVDIADMLNVMEAHVSLMEFENIRILREMRGNVNRKVNCETANIGKTVSAAMKQIADINYIKETEGLSYLDESLRQIAQVRLDNPDVPLSKLGDLLDPPVGKSGVNHRLRKISGIAEELKKENQEFKDQW